MRNSNASSEEYICSNWCISNEEYEELETEFGRLSNKQGWQLLSRNTRNNHTEDFLDVKQELSIGLIKAGSYFKRQLYIEAALDTAKKHTKDNFIIFILSELEKLWHNRKRHGANRQKFGLHQELLLDKILKKCVPHSERPIKNGRLKIDPRFSNYCKAITWNSQKSMGRKITKEKSIRSNAVSLSQFDYLGGNERGGL